MTEVAHLTGRDKLIVEALKSGKFLVREGILDQLEDIDRSLEKFPHCDLADARDGFKVVEMPIVFTERLHGHSKMSGHIVLEAIIMVWRLWFQNGLRRWPRKRR